MSETNGAHRLRVGVDVRCLGAGELRGFARYTLELVHALSARPALDVVALSDVALDFELPVPLRHFVGGRELVREQVALASAAARERLDVLLAPANRGLPWAAPCATVLTLHDAVEWDPDLVTPPRGKSRFRFAYASVLSLASADLVITVSHASAARICDRLRVPARRVRVVHEAASERLTHDPGANAVNRLCDRLGVSAGFVLYLGGFDKKKDVATLLRGLAGLVRRGEEVVLVIAGGASAEQIALERLAAQLGITSSVRWVGFVDDEDLPSLYRAASCFVFPAVAEGFGLPAVEAMACGTPVIAARAASLPEVIGTGGLLFAPGDDAELAQTLRGVLHCSASERQALCARATERARAFSWERTAEATERVLREAVAIPRDLRWRRRVAELARWRDRLPPSNRVDPTAERRLEPVSVHR
jgi:glycosyltransferase involved in cell wall biosynthesis